MCIPCIYTIAWTWPIIFITKLYSMIHQTPWLNKNVGHFSSFIFTFIPFCFEYFCFCFYCCCFAFYIVCWLISWSVCDGWVRGCVNTTSILILFIHHVWKYMHRFCLYLLNCCYRIFPFIYLASLYPVINLSESNVLITSIHFTK